MIKTNKKQMEFREDILEFALKKADRMNFCDEIIVRLEKNKSNHFLMKNGQIENYDFDETEGINVMALTKKGAKAFFSTNNFEKFNIQNKLNQLQKSIQKQDKLLKISSDRDNDINEKKKQIKKLDIIKQKKKISNIPIKDKIEYLKNIQETIDEFKKTLNPNLMIQSYVSFTDSEKEKLIVSNKGIRIKTIYPKTNLFYFLTGIENIKNNTRTAQRYWQYGQTGGWEGLEKQNIPQVFQSELKSISLNLSTKNIIKPQKTDVIVGPEVVGIMVHESVGHPYEADRILGREKAQAGGSFVNSKMLNTRIGSEIPSVSDDPRIKGSFGYYLYDDEGTKATEKQLMKKGMINEFLQNKESALQMNQVLSEQDKNKMQIPYKKIQSNGAARALSYENEPIVRMSNTFLKPGEYSESELIKETKKGIYIKNFTEWNIDDKRLSQKYVGFEAYEIKNGKLVGAVKSPVIEINTPQLWSSVSAVANNVEYHAGTCGKGEPMQGIPVWFGGPSMKLSNIRVYSSK